MNTIILTLIAAFIVVLIAVGLLAISWLIKGKSSLKPGACGRDPTKKKADQPGCGTGVSCDLCEHPDTKPKK